MHGILLPYPTIAAQLPNHDIPFFKYLQLRHFLQSHQRNPPWHRELTQLELLCSSTELQGHLISTIYSLLFSRTKVKDDKIVRQWEHELSIDLTTSEWDRIFTLMHKGSINVSTQNGIERRISFTTFTPLSLQPAGDVMQPAVPYFTSGGNVPLYNHSGQKFTD